MVGQKHALLCGFFREAGIEIVASDAGLYLWIRTPSGRTDEDWAMALLVHGIVVSPGGMFGVAGGGRGFVRVALVPSLQEIGDAIDVWRRLL